MKWKLGLAAFLAPTLAFALSVDERVAQLEKKMNYVYTKNEMDGMGAKNASALPSNEMTKWHFQVGFTYEVPTVQGIEYCTKDNMTIGSISPNSTITHEIVEPNLDWDWGFLVGAGYKVPDYNWDIELNYHTFKNRTSHKVSVDTDMPGVISQLKGFPLLSGVNAFRTCKEATTDFSMDFDLLDFTATSAFFTNRVFALEVLMGVRSHWLTFKQKTNYSGGSLLGVNSFRVDDKSDFWGIGPLAGLNSKWIFGRGFGLFSNLTFAYLYGSFDVTKDQNNTERNFKMNDVYSFHAGVPELNSTLGLMYESYFRGHDHYFSIQLGYNFGYFWSVNQMLVNRDDSAYLGSVTADGNMDEHGLMCRARFDF